MAVIMLSQQQFGRGAKLSKRNGVSMVGNKE